MMIKYFLVLGLSLIFTFSSRLSGAVSPRSSHVEKLLQEIVHKEVPAATRVAFQSLHVPVEIPRHAEVVSFQPSPPIGFVMFECVWEEKGAIKRISGTANIKVYARVAVAKGPIHHGEAFSEINTAFEEREISTLKVSGFYSERAPLAAVRSRGYIAASSVIGLAQTEVPLLVTAGQIVQLYSEARNLRVTARVKALESGRLGQWIKVENPSSRKTLFGRVESSGVLSLH